MQKQPALHNSDAIHISEIAWAPFILTSVASLGQVDILMVKKDVPLTSWKQSLQGTVGSNV